MAKLSGKIAVVTGGGSGIGRSTALMLAAEGAHVVLSGRRKAPLDAVVAEIARIGGKAVAHAGDVSRPEQGRALVERVVKELGRVDILINNAGHSSKARNVRWVGQEEWDAVINVNLTGVYALIQAALPGMIERGGGSIVTVGSVAALRPGLIGGAPYGAAKAGVLNLMGHVHTVLRDRGIRATTVMPAEVNTPILDNGPLPPDAAARATLMQPEDVAAAILMCVTLPARTVVEEIVLSPTRTRDQSRDLEVSRNLGAPPGAS